MGLIYPPPGSPEAVALGCLCAVIDNGHGKGCGRVDGEGNPLYWITKDCPVHCMEVRHAR